MKTLLASFCIALTLAWAAAAHASSNTADVESSLEDNHIDIRSLLAPGVAMPKTDPVAVALPADASIAERQLGELLKINLEAQGFTVTTPDKSKWTFAAKIDDRAFVLAVDQRVVAEAHPVEYALVTVTASPSGDPGHPAWISSVRSYSRYWATDQEHVVEAILATYGHNFYYRDVRTAKVADYVEDDDNQPPTLEKIKACLAQPKGEGCSKILND